jgi:hypothetical protein
MAFEVWLRPNRRPAIVLLCGSTLVALVALLVAAQSSPWVTTGRRVLAGASAAAGLIALFTAATALLRARRPRVYRHDAQVCFRLGPRGPSGVPLDVIEAFFLGQGPARLPGRIGERLESVNLVARLARRAEQWHRRDVHPRLGQWCDGYITVRGTCCEPLDTETIHRLNRLLHDAKQEPAHRG